MRTKLRYVLALTMILSYFSIYGQDKHWSKIKSTQKDLQQVNYLNIKNGNFYTLNPITFINALRGAPLRSNNKHQNGITINLPSNKGIIEQFKVFEAPVFSPELSAKYPNIKSYIGYGITTKGARIRMSTSHHGVQIMISYADKSTIFMQPISRGSSKYILYSRAENEKIKNKFECSTIDKINELSSKSISKSVVDEGGANDETLKKFRIAISVTGEYTAYHGGTVPDALAAINTTLSRVNEVFETDMAITFELIGNNDLVIYTDSATDPYSDAGTGTNGAWNTEVQNTLTSIITNSNYDIGHLFGASGGGGNAGCIGCVCVDDSPSPNDQNKGSAYTSPSNGVPSGDTFDIDFVAHEIGHQMGANHTWSYASEGEGVNVEPGSGSTIMGYAGITGADDVQNNSDDYFHYASIKQILDNIVGKCQTNETITTNNAPSADAGSDYHIPKSTPYFLKGSATDPDGGDILTYCWEQIDDGITTSGNFGPTLASGAMNRSLPPSTSDIRYIPKLSSVVNGNIEQTNPTVGSDWETVSSVARDLNWALTVRDRSPSSPAGGQSSYDTMTITVEDVDPFTIVNPTIWSQGSSQNITWNVGQTNNGTINCQSVNILLSTDGGATFNTIVSGTPNDGSHTYNVPAMANTTQARIIVEAADNIFYDVSDYNFLITSKPTFLLVDQSGEQTICLGGNSVSFNIDFVTGNGFSENITFGATGNPASSSVSFSPSSLSSDGTTVMTINNLNSVTDGSYTVTVTGTSASANRSLDVAFSKGHCVSIANTTYDTSTTLVDFNTINNASAKPSGYSDYTNISTNVNRNSSYNLTVNANTDGNFTTETLVWIDWNQDCNFDDDGEQYDLGTTNNNPDGATGNSPLSVPIPNDAILGNTIMRVTTKFLGDGSPTACENGADAEVEDYTINVQASLAVEEFGFENFAVFPNPNSGQFTIKLNASLSSKINVDVYDIRGRKVYNKHFKNAGDFNEDINLGNIQSGLYLLNVTDGTRKSSRKIVVN